MLARDWIATFAARLGVDPPGDAAIDQLLAIAAVAAHASERTGAGGVCAAEVFGPRSPVSATSHLVVVGQRIPGERRAELDAMVRGGARAEPRWSRRSGIG